MNINSQHRNLLLVAPWAILGTTYVVFQLAVAALGPKAGYLAGFGFYWLVWCGLFPLWIVGWRGLRELFARVNGGLRLWPEGVLLAIPPLLSGLTVFPVRIAQADWLIVTASFLLAAVNATGEEILWRGLYMRGFPRSVGLGYIYPAVGFAIWHLSPQVIHPISMPGGVYSFLAGALFLGLCWGWAARKSNSIRWTVISHILTNFLGLGAIIYFN